MVACVGDVFRQLARAARSVLKTQAVDTNNEMLKQLVLDWAWDGSKHYAPRTLDDVGDEAFMEMIQLAHETVDLDYMVKIAFVGEYQEEESQEEEQLETPDETEEVIQSMADEESEACAQERREKEQRGTKRRKKG